jgi:NAD(P)-dependent dehydrogenase (short-subunit alcohol dehydrogenase family)
MISLAGSRAVVIGGSSGIGRTIALGFQRYGARVAIAGRTASKTEAVAAELHRGGGESRAYVCDVTDMAKLDELVQNAIADLGAIDVLVNCQGVTALKAAEDFTEADYDSIMAANIKSVFFACTMVGRHMLARGNGSIINIASMAAHRGWPRSAIYAVSKHGVIGLTKTLAAEWAARGVRVNALSPGFFPTPLSQSAMNPERKERALRRTPMGRFGELEELVGAAVFLASAEAKFITGAVINVDGGYLAGGI